MQTMESIKAIVDNISYNDWTIRLDRYADNGPPYVQILFMDKDRITGNLEQQRCRKWVLSFFMTDSEVVRTTFQAIQQAALHEVQEAFKYKGKRIFNPHMDYDALAQNIANGNIGVVVREEMPKP